MLDPKSTPDIRIEDSGSGGNGLDSTTLDFVAIFFLRISAPFDVDCCDNRDAFFFEQVHVLAGPPAGTGMGEVDKEFGNDEIDDIVIDWGTSPSVWNFFSLAI